MASLEKATTDLMDNVAMILERQPALKPILDAKMAALAQEVGEVFAPIIDYGEGRITREQYDAIITERERVETERRRAHYGTKWLELGFLMVPCEWCGTTHEWRFDERDGEYPPVFFECEDVTGEDCRDDSDDDDI